MRFRWLAPFFLASTLLSNAAPLEIPADESLLLLTQTDFNATLAKDLWLVEFFSPHCGHCRRFKPTWQQLLIEKSAGSAFGFRMAQVDCIAQGDLCNEQNIDYYPKINLYQDGEVMETYNGDRSLPDLSAYVDGHVRRFVRRDAALESRQEIIPNKLGRVLQLTGDSFISAVSEGPLFVKMFAPWCGHCKKLAPVWTELASKMQGIVNIAEINCDDHPSLCKKEKVEGYPTLSLYQNGKKVEYRGARKIDALEPWIVNAVATASGLKHIVANELGPLIEKDPAVFLYLHTLSSSKEHLDLVTRGAHAHLGGPPMYQSNDPELFEELNVDPSIGSVIIGFKDHQKSPDAFLPITSESSLSVIERWLGQHRFPSAMELTSNNFHDVMRSSHALVVLTPTERENSVHVTDTLREASKSWARRSNPYPVLFVWMDWERWESWLNNMYGIKKTQSSPVIIADHQRLIYYDTNESKAPIVLDSAQIVNALNSVFSGAVRAKYSENWIERQARSIHDALEGLGEALALHPALAILFVVLGLAAVFFFVQRIVGDDTRDFENRRRGKEGARLD